MSVVNNKKILITSYMRNDIDGLACVYAYSEYLRKKGTDAVGAIFGKPHREAQFVLDRFKVKKLADAGRLIKTRDNIVLVDASDTKGISPRIHPEDVIEIIDHRKVNEAEKFPNAKKQIEFVGAAATLIAEKFRTDEIEVSNESATLLALAIVSNTVNFKAKVTTGRDIKMYKWLIKKTKLSRNTIHEMFMHKSKPAFIRPLKKLFEEDFATLSLGGKSFGIAQLEIVGAEKFVRKRLNEIKDALLKIKKEKSQDLIFLTCLDVEKGLSIFVAVDKSSEELINSTLNIKFNNGVAKRKGVLLRKEITPMIKEKMML